MAQMTIRLLTGNPVTLNTRHIRTTWIDEDRGHTVIQLINDDRYFTKEPQKDLQDRINRVEGGDLSAAAT